MYLFEKVKLAGQMAINKMHVYEVDPMVVDYGPGQVESFRDIKTYKTSVGRDSFRANTFADTPKKNIKNNKTSILNTIVTNGSAKKTVRFVESTDGLLKTAPFESSFNNFEYIG